MSALLLYVPARADFLRTCSAPERVPTGQRQLGEGNVACCILYMMADVRMMQDWLARRR